MHKAREMEKRKGKTVWRNWLNVLYEANYWPHVDSSALPAGLRKGLSNEVRPVKMKGLILI